MKCIHDGDFKLYLSNEGSQYILYIFQNTKHVRLANINFTSLNKEGVHLEKALVGIDGDCFSERQLHNSGIMSFLLSYCLYNFLSKNKNLDFKITTNNISQQWKRDEINVYDAYIKDYIGENKFRSIYYAEERVMDIEKLKKDCQRHYKKMMKKLLTKENGVTIGKQYYTHVRAL
ncbi:hypothetical protein [Vagococcus hydrophili]|uniref:Uncharacterized protein n=1 Tax=Vagococcus hydrophili TaxID=2714947 RepID=A0A6G8APW2_9ENTE|nr:hypothetical protein [Vagococcus hydrophili]QIL47027.1 hypothetical protein G7082_00020 [Vagococcus hydrophili]